MTITTCIFDAYGTLFDVGAAARLAAQEPDHAVLRDIWPQIARDWRHKQLQYTWLRAVAGQHCDFWQVTQDGLDWAMDAGKLVAPETRERLLALYWELDAYPEVPEMLAKLQTRGLNTGILSNGSPEMLEAAVSSAGLEALIDVNLSVESVGVFKPHKSVYDLVGHHFGCPPSQVLFVSSNGWDAAGAAKYGFRTAWVNRADEPKDRLFADPHHTLSDLTGILELV